MLMRVSSWLHRIGSRRLLQRAIIVPLLSLGLAACRELAATPEPSVSATLLPPAPTSTPAPTPIPPPTLTPTPVLNNLWLDPSGVRVYPDGRLYSGDILSFRVEAQNGSDQDLAHVPVVVNWGSDQVAGEINRIPHGDSASTDFLWVWDTAGLVGTHTVTVTVDSENRTGDPDVSNNIAVIPIELRPGRPVAEIGAQWQTTTGACCTFHYIDGTAAARDLAAIKQTADEAVDYVEERLDIRQNDRLEVYLIDRVLGHGGFAGDHLVISYLDRNYAGGGLVEVFRHEATHLLDHRIARGERPIMLVEGFATYITGGHFTIEPLPERAAMLAPLDAYIPLRELANNFYPSQHETGYLEAGAFIDYLVQRNGYANFMALYDGMQRQPGETDAEMIDREMRGVYGVGLDELEAEWQAYLRTLDTAAEQRDVEYTLAFYDTVRRYQRALDPSAYFLSPWIPDIRQAAARQIVADYLRHPNTPENIALETMLVAADAAFLVEDFDRVEALLASTNTVLAADVVFTDPLAARYLAIVNATLLAGYEPHHITLYAERAEVQATVGGDATLTSLAVAQQAGAWSVQLSR